MSLQTGHSECALFLLLLLTVNDNNTRISISIIIRSLSTLKNTGQAGKKTERMRG